MNIYTTLATLKTYRDSDRVSQSFLKKILVNDTKPFKETVPMLIGSYLDCLLTSPHLKDDLFIEDLNKRPSENIRGFLNTLLEILVSTDSVSNLGELRDYKEVLIPIVRGSNYQPKWGDDALWNSIEKDGAEYWEFMLKAEGRSIITYEEKVKCENLAALTLSHELTGKYFIDQPNVDKYYQQAIYWNEGEVLCKGLADLVIIEEDTKTIYLVDLKSTGVNTIEEWFKICRQKMYPFQMSFYLKGILNNFSPLIEDGYKVLCRWVVVPTNGEKFTPFVVNCGESLLEIGQYGYQEEKYFINPSNHETNFYHKDTYGWWEAIKRYKHFTSKGILDYNMLYDQTQGRIDENVAENLFFTN